MSAWRNTFLLGLICGIVMVGCPEDDPQGDDDDNDDDSAAGDDDVADDDSASDDDDSAGDDDDSAAGAPDIVTQPSNLDFGTVSVGASADINLNIRNIGNVPLVINDMVSPLTQLSFTAFSGPIPPGGNESVVITGNCTIEEEVAGALIIVSNDPDENPLHVVTAMICDEI